MRVLKQSTAVTRLIGPFLDKTDGVTEETGLGGTGTELSKEGGAFAAGPTLGTHDSDGWYPIALTTTHTNTLGDLTVKVHDATTHLPVWAHFMVVPANVYDSWVNGTGVGVRADVQGWLGTAPAAVTVAGVPEVDVTHWRGTAAPAPTVAGVPAVEVIDVSSAGKTDIAAAVLDEDMTAHQTQGTLGQAIGDPAADTNTIYKAVVTDATGATVGVDAAAILDDTGTSGVAVANGALTAAKFGAGAIDAAALAADAGGEIADAVWDEDIVAAHGTADTAGRALRTLDTISDRTNNSNLNALLGVADSAGADVPSQVSDEVWDEAQAGHVGAGTFGEVATEIADILVDTGTTLQGEVDGIQADTEDIQARLPAALVGGRIDATVDATGMEAGAVDAILDETIGDSTVTFRQALRLFVAALGGKASGLATTTARYRNVADDKDRITATVDVDGNRSAVTLDLS